MSKRISSARLMSGAFRMLPFKTAVRISKQMLAAQGFGAGTEPGSSGETGVFRLVDAGQPVLFDVGGHVGDYTEAFLAHCPSGRAVVFEPSAHHLAVLRQRLGARAEVQILPVGLGAETARLPLYKDREISGLASLSQRRLDHFDITMDQVETVDISTVDQVVADLGVTTIDLLKIDVEGHELAVLRGATATLARGIVKLVQFEFGGCNLDTRTNLQDFYYFFKTYGFAIGLVQPSGRIQVLDRYDEFYEQYRTANFVAAPRERLVR